MSPAKPKPLQRLRYWQGQALLSRDFRDQDRLDAHRRELHNCALHDVPGVVAWHPEEGHFGLEVEPQKDGAPGFTVNCGVAYDCSGRLLLLQQPRDIGPPETSATLVLQARQEVFASVCCSTPPDAGCPTPHAAALENEVELTWRPQGSLDSSRGVLLARVNVDGENISLDNGFQPRPARPIARARLARGETVRANTPWERWEIDEPDGQGGLKKRVVGVQTHIDTSASGFTATPNYFATLTSPGWDLAKTEFAPSFFPQVADPTVDGFLFRLLMVETARRRYNVLAGTTRVTRTARVAGDRLQIDVENAGAFRQNDAVALLRPRGDAAFRILKVSGETLTLESPLPAAVTAPAVLSVGHTPRIAKVLTVKPGDPTVLVSVSSPVAIKKNDILLRLDDSAVTIVNSAGSKGLTIQEPFSNWKKEEPIGFALRSSAVAVKRTQNDATKSTIVTTKAHGITTPASVVGLDDKKRPTGTIASLTPTADDTLEVKPALTEVALGAIKHLSLVRKEITVNDIQAQNPGEVVQVDDVGSFAEGDFIAALNNLSVITVIDDVDTGRKELSLRASIKPTGTVAAADWIAATTVAAPSVAGAAGQIVVGRAGAVSESSFVVRVEADGFSEPFPVKAVAGTVVTLAKSFDGLNRLDTLAVGVFPRIVTVLGSDSGGIRIAEAGALKAGDVLIPMNPAAGPLTLSEVVSAAGDLVQLNPPLTSLTPGVTQLGVVTFTDATQVTGVPTGTPPRVKVDKELEGRSGDFVAPLTHYVDNSNAGTIAEIAGSRITLAGPGIASGDGIIQEDWIDGGILGPAALTTFDQPLARLETSDGLAQGFQQAVASGYDLVAHRFVSHSVWVYLTEASLNRVYVWPAVFFDSYRYRPETLALITTFNTDFPSAFATFAQKQNLAVCWIGCQQEFPPPSGCPGVVPTTGCCGSSGE